MRRLLFLGALLSATILTASCFNPQPDPPFGPQPDPPADISDAGGGDATTGDGGAMDGGPCPDWLGNKPGEACSVQPTIECGGNAEQWASYCFLRCCGGHWLGPTDVGACGQGAPPCP